MHFVYGDNTEKINVGGGPTKPDFNDLAGTSLTMNRDWLTLRAGYIQTEMDISVDSLPPLVVGWTVEGFPEVTDYLLVGEDISSFVELGFELNLSGKGKPPKELGTDAEVLKHVAKNINAIGYVNAGSVDDSVKVLKTF